MHLSFINRCNICPFLLIHLYGDDGVLPALLLFVILNYKHGNTNSSSDPFRIPATFEYETIRVERPILKSLFILVLKTLTVFIMTNLSCSFLSVLLLLLCGDVHPNPGPMLQENSSNISIVHNNICSLQQKRDNVEAELSNFDIIALSETWLYEDFPSDKLSIKGYHPPIRLDRPSDTQYHHGGVAVYVKDHLYCKHRPEFNVPGLEAVWIETKINQDPLLIGCIYRSPEKLVYYWDLIDESIKLALRTPHKIIILGDLNEDCLPIPGIHVQRIMNLNGLDQMITQPTRYTDGSARLIDLILTPCPHIIEKTGVLPPVKSDHCCTFVEIKTNQPVQKSFKRTLYIYSKLNEGRFLDEARLVDWCGIVNSDTIDAAAELLSQKLMDIGKACMPVKTITVRYNDAPWITEEIKKLIKKKHRIFALAKTLDSVWSWDLFKRTRNYLVELIRNRKKEYHTDLENRINTQTNFGTKDWWKIVNNFFNRQSFSDIPPLQNNNSNEIVYLPEHKAELFNDFFVKQSRINNIDDELPHIEFTGITAPTILFTREMVYKVIKDLDQSKAVGPDLIHNKLLVKSAEFLSEPLTILFNRSIAESRFPYSWKIAHVTPIHKKGDKSICNNYRPISLLSCVGKIMEKCIQKHVFAFLTEHNLLTLSQSGFIPGDSTTYQLLSIYDDFFKSLDRKSITQAVFFDISKAFDRVWHRGLIHKLNAIGIRGPLLNWFEDYLNGRKQAVVIKGKISSYKAVQSGVPQGSVLGPLLFLIFINDIVKDIESLVKLFADDTSMYLQLNDGVIRTYILNSDIAKILDWSRRWKVDFNPAKTELLTIANLKDYYTYPLLFDDSILLETNEHKHLGVILQNDCRWNSHIESIIAKTRPLIACFRSYKYKFNRKTLEILYKSYILPHFDYADVVWDNCSTNLSNELENIQLDALRTITGAVKGTSHEKLYKESGFISLKERRKRHKLILFFKLVNGLLPDYLNDYIPPLVSDTNPYPRRRPSERQVPEFRLETYRDSFFPSTTELWNDLSDIVKEQISISSFKRKICAGDPLVPPYYYIGSRKPQTVHCKLRLNMSDLNNDLFLRHISENKECECGFRKEDADHFLLKCPRFEIARSTSINILPPIAKNINNLLYGNHAFSLAFNCYIFHAVQDYIIQSERF